jgi:hypothetical protein
MINIIIIIFLIFLIVGISLKIYYNRETFQNKLKIAVFCYNFGNFRNELKKKSIDRFNKDDRFDYYFYTDQNDITSEKWKIINVPLRQRTPHMNANRVTAKYYKWKIIPDEIKKYDYILHIDCAKIEWLNKFTYDNIIDLIKNNPNVLFFARKQPKHNNIYEEAGSNWHRGHVDDTEYGDNADRWIQKLKNEKFVQKFTHVETGLYLKKNDKRLNSILTYIYDKLMDQELCRDQHVFPYVLQKEGLKLSEFLIYEKF